MNKVDLVVQDVSEGNLSAMSFEPGSKVRRVIGITHPRTGVVLQRPDLLPPLKLLHAGCPTCACIAEREHPPSLWVLVEWNEWRGRPGLDFYHESHPRFDPNGEKMKVWEHPDDLEVIK